jgi:ribosomal protein S18 acetylase RimI-like enzyme
MATHDKYAGRGIGSRLLRHFIKIETERGFYELSVPKKLISVQTNSAPENDRVIIWYNSFSFYVSGHKVYANRTDLILNKDI